jgi:hypothetical protein
MGTVVAGPWSLSPQRRRQPENVPIDRVQYPEHFQTGADEIQETLKAIFGAKAERSA